MKRSALRLAAGAVCLGATFIASPAAAIVGGGISPAEHDASVFLVYDYDGDLNGDWCSGTLLAPNLVATARHCVEETSESSYACGANGEPMGANGGGMVIGEREPIKVKVFAGNENHLIDQIPDARGAQILTDNSNTLCSHDIAIVVLDRAIDYVRQPLQLEPPERGEMVTAVGWGNPNPGVVMWQLGRTYLTNLPVIDVGATVADPSLEGIGIVPRTFYTGPAICFGDSGATAYNDQLSIIGVGVRTVAAPGGISTICSNPTARSQYMQLGPFADLIEEAHDVAGQDIWLEGEPTLASVAVGNACSADKFCSSDACVLDADGDSGVCATVCSADIECAGQICEDRGHAIGSVCVNALPEPAEAAEPAASSDAGGCSVSAPKDGSLGWLLIVSLLGFSLSGRRGYFLRARGRGMS